MDKNTIVGFSLLALLLLAYVYINRPSEQDLENYRRYQDSIAQVLEQERVKDSLIQAQKAEKAAELNRVKADSSLTEAQRDSLMQVLQGDKKGVLVEAFGKFTKASIGEEKLFTLENNKLKITLSNRGGRIRSVEVLGFEKYNHETPEDQYDKAPVKLMANGQDRFNWLVPHQAAGRGAINTQDLFFEAEQDGQTLVFRAYTDDSREQFIEQRYSLSADAYTMDYDFRLQNLRSSIPATAKFINLEWVSYLDKIEKNAQYESTVSSVHYREAESSPSYCSCASNDNVELPGEPLHWVSHSQQFFTMGLIAKNEAFAGASLSTLMTPDRPYLKVLGSQLSLSYKDQDQYSHAMQWYLGPNDYNQMAALNVKLEQIIPFGWGFFGTIGRYLIRPLFNFLAGFIGSYGLIIIILTLLIKLATYPLQHKLALSSVKMTLIKPEIEKLRKKYEKDPQALQMEQMKLYNTYGVSPLAGCMPMLITMPIWIALYRFFPASIEFRQKPFLWAEDLASYDSILDLGFHIPLYGDHISLFTLLWTISMFAFLHYNSKQMDMSSMGGGNEMNAKVMKYFQYGFPIIFFFTLNSWASGLTAYMFFSNLFNIIQTYLSKNVLINKDKVWAKMQEVKNNPTKAAGTSWLEQAMRQQQEEQARRKGKKS